MSLLKSVASFISSQIHPHLKLGVDAIWLAYGAAQLKDEWTKSNADQVSCAFKLASLSFSAISLMGEFNSELKLPDSWSNGINFYLTSGEAIYQGKTPPINELALLAKDKRMDIPLKLLKLAGASLDPQAATSSTAQAKISNLTFLTP
ncbi:hypothetical protein [Cyanobium sp. NIES-981]|uniref:hypothetical protein n=1 Tax=Cyanobium sp. NIES-981 TaxID=1851505 RepID=UPI0012F839F4|nr:hypothetical protein [Cyanobium sp. NIES-981]